MDEHGNGHAYRDGDGDTNGNGHTDKDGDGDTDGDADANAYGDGDNVADADVHSHERADAHTHTDGDGNDGDTILLQALRSHQQTMWRFVYFTELHVPQAAGVRVPVITSAGITTRGDPCTACTMSSWP
jgi:hypothetical protein